MIAHVEEMARCGATKTSLPMAADVSMNMLQLVDLEHRTGGAFVGACQFLK